MLLRLTACLLVVLAVVSPSARAGDEPAQEPDGHGGGEFLIEKAQDLTDAQRQEIQRLIDRNIEDLTARGKLPLSLAANVSLDWPLRLAPGLHDMGYHGISNFVDHNPATQGFLLDYQCGARTYDTAGGYNHKGTDYFLWPFTWRKMDAGDVQIVAAAPGTILLRQDGNYDRNCAMNTNAWNAVYIRHADGSVAWYGHMKSGSLTSKGVGDTVAAGEYLGSVGSSGSSTGPHLHLEVYDSAGALNDPWQGPCNDMNAATWWNAQRPYYDSALNLMTTGYAAAVFPACPNPESPNTQTAFARGTPAYFTAYYRDQLQGQVSQYRIRRPDGSLYWSTNHSSPASHYAASWWYWYWNTFAAGGPDGIWTFEIDYQGKTHTLPFVIGSAPAGRVPGDIEGESPLTVTRSGAKDLVLEWSPSCGGADTDFEIYEGTLGDYDSHVPVVCTTRGATRHTLTPSAGDVYYLVVPTNGSREGSHGLDGAGFQRPAGAASCRVREIATCGP